MNWLQKLFHKHTPIWKSRKVIQKTSISFDEGVQVDVQPATVYLLKGYCLKCHANIQKTYVVLDIFDQEQPYDE